MAKPPVVFFRRAFWGGWAGWLPMLVAAVWLLPVAFLLRHAFAAGRTALWIDAGPMVAGLTGTTLYLLLVALPVAGLLGGGSAWALTRFDFPGRRAVSVLLCLPLTLPPYLLAGIYQSLQHRGSLPLPPLEHPTAAGVLLGVALYPWVYLPLKVQLAGYPAGWRELGQALGLDARSRFFRIHLGLLAPALGVGLLLVAMEVVSDYGTTSLLGVRSLSVGIHDAMFSMYRRDWAAQLSLLGLAIPLAGIGAFAALYRRRVVWGSPNRAGADARVPLCGTRLVAWGLGILIPLLAGFVVPFTALVTWAMSHLNRVPLHELPDQAWDTVRVTALVAVATLLLALALNVLPRLRGDRRGWGVVLPAVNLNYAMPAVMLAIAVLFLSADAPTFLQEYLLSSGVGLLVLGGVLGTLCFPYLSVHAGLQRLSPRLDDLGRCLGWGWTTRLRRVYLPLLARPLACGTLLVVVQMARELPLTETLQPFGHQSLAQRLHGFAGLGMVEESALQALCLVALLVYPVIALDRLLSEAGEAGC